MSVERTGLAILAALVLAGCARIEAGHRGVLFRNLGEGTVIEETYGEGIHIVAPWNQMIPYDVRWRDQQENVEILTSNGLSVTMDVSIRFRPNNRDLPLLHRDVGAAYYAQIVQPTMRSEVRKVVGHFTPEEIYSSKRQQVEAAIFDSVKQALETKFLDVEAILIRHVGLPQQLQTAISEKLEEEQRALKMEFVLNRERQEAERKRIEAQGVADFQKIVSQGISEQLLRWKGIEATEHLATSTNSKVVVIGSGTDGLPLILGGAG